MQLTICTYNVNGLASVRQHAADISLAGILEQLGADVVCFQETKLSHSDLWPMAFQRLADVPGWDSYFCFTRKGSYSGVATYCRTAVTTVRAAEEGLLRILPPQNPVAAAAAAATAAAHAGTARPAAAQATAGAENGHACLRQASAAWPNDIVFPEEQLRSMFTAEEALAVDKDGRCIITDHGLFVLFNCYFPACSGNNGLEQIEVKRHMWRAVDVRMRALLAAGRHIVLAGDFNVVLPWWGQHHTVRGSGVEKRVASLNRLAASQADAAASEQQQEDLQQQPHAQAQVSSSLELFDNGAFQEAASSHPQGVASASQQQQQQQQQAYVGQQQLQGVRVQPRPVSQEDNFAPHAQYRIGKPVLPSSGTAEWLIQLTTLPEEASPGSAQSISTQPTAGVLVDTLKALNPGVQLFRYPDAKKPGRFKERPPYTNWSQFHGNRNDQYGARSDYIFVGDAADYAIKLRQLQQYQQDTQQQDLASLPVPRQQPPPQQSQQPSLQQAFSISLLSALSSASILRELRWTDHAPVVLQLQLPAQAAHLLRSPAADPALRHSMSTPSQLQHQHHPMRMPPIPVQTPVQTATVLQFDTPQQGAADSVHHASTGASTAPGTASGACSSVVGCSTGGVTLPPPCPLSSHWLTQPDAAATTAAAIFAAAGVQRTPSEVLTCSILQQLRHAQYTAATGSIAARARQLYKSAGDVTPDAAAAADSAGQPAVVHSQGGIALNPAWPADAQAFSAAAVQQGALQPPAQPLPSPTQPPSVPSAAVDQQQAQAHRTQSGAAQQQKPRWWARQRHSKQPAAGRQQRQPVGPTTPATGAKRKGRGWRVVSMGDGRTATVACSSSDDSGG